jgi:hypothetical protein
MALALASSGLTSMIPMKTGGWWFSPSRLRDLLAIILPMIASTNLFNRLNATIRQGAGSQNWERFWSSLWGASLMVLNIPAFPVVHEGGHDQWKHIGSLC